MTYWIFLGSFALQWLHIGTIKRSWIFLFLFRFSWWNVHIDFIIFLLIYHNMMMAKYPADLYWLPHDSPSSPKTKYSAMVKIGKGRPRAMAFLKLSPIWLLSIQVNLSLKSMSGVLLFTGNPRSVIFTCPKPTWTPMLEAIFSLENALYVLVIEASDTCHDDP